MINKLRQKNIELFKKYHYENDEENENKQKLIALMLKHDDCFLKISINQAFAIFRELGFKKEDYPNIYLQLTKPKN